MSKRIQIIGFIINFHAQSWPFVASQSNTLCHSRTCGPSDGGPAAGWRKQKHVGLEANRLVTARTGLYCTCVIIFQTSPSFSFFERLRPAADSALSDPDSYPQFEFEKYRNFHFRCVKFCPNLFSTNWEGNDLRRVFL